MAVSRERGDSGIDPARGLLAAVVFHVIVGWAITELEPPVPVKRELIEYEVARLPPEPKPEPSKPEPPKPEPPKPEPKPEPPKPEPELQKPLPKPKTQKPPPTPQPPQPPSAPPAPQRFKLPPSQSISGGNSGVKVDSGDAATPGRNDGEERGDPKATKPGKPGGEGTDPAAPPGPPWEPKGDIYVRTTPVRIRVPELECPAVARERISGAVVLLVQVRRTGAVKAVRVTKKMGYGCDEIAAKALRQAKFAPAIDTSGKPVDYELRYDYEFELKQ